jgi:hypothetical protein
MAIPQGRDAASFALACQSITGGSDDFDRIGTNKQVGTFRDGDGALGVLAQGETGNAESGGFFLDAAGIGEDELGFAQETEKIEIPTGGISPPGAVQFSGDWGALRRYSGFSGVGS